MLSYRHAFHAGNVADVLKHFTLWRVLHYYNQKDKPYFYIDTHAGAGAYALDSAEAQKNGEFLTGIARLQQRADLPALLQQFVAFLAKVTPRNHYLGSPLLARHCLAERAGNQMRLFECHPADVAILQHHLTPSATPHPVKTQIAAEDGWRGLLRVLPPHTRRAVTLIDPPYEDKNDYQRALDTLTAARKRFATGCYLLWYPCLRHPAAQNFAERVLAAEKSPFVHARLDTSRPRPDGFGMFGSGMIILNPPYVLPAQLAEIWPTLVEIFAHPAGQSQLTHNL